MGRCPLVYLLGLLFDMEDENASGIIGVLAPCNTEKKKMLSYLMILSARICISIAITMPTTIAHRARVERIGTCPIGASSREQYPMRVTGPHTQ